MTIGERIAQIRKERGLSQEAFAETLGVTRQSISKWELNTSIPEVDKLLMIAKLYEVSVGWILGEDTEKTPVEDRELTEEQLRMVEQIAEKYIAAIPVQKSKWKRWQKLLAAICLLILGAWSINLYNEISALNSSYHTLANNIVMLENNLYSEMNGMTSRVEEILEQQNHLLAYYETDVAAVDVGAETVTMTASIVPKSYVENMTVDFIFESNGQMYRVSAEEGEGNKFSCQHEFPYSDLINVSVILKTGELEQTQLMDCYEGVESSTKVKLLWETNNDLWGRISDIKGVHTLCVTLENPQKAYVNGQVYAQDVVWRIFVNDELVQEIPAKRGLQTADGRENEIVAYGDVEREFLRSLKKKDTLCIALVVTDNYDRSYVVDIIDYEVTETKPGYTFLDFKEGSIDWNDPKWLE